MLSSKNSLQNQGTGFGHDTNQITMINRGGPIKKFRIEAQNRSSQGHREQHNSYDCQTFQNEYLCCFMKNKFNITKSRFDRCLAVFCLLLTPVFFSQCMSFRKTDQEITAYFENSPVKPSFGFANVGSRKIHYAEIGSDTLPLVVFVHGSPGSWTAFIDFFKDSILYRHAHLVSVDRLGFGKSGLGKVESSMQKQAEAIVAVITAAAPGSRALLVGHSLGGPVIARAAMDYPSQISGLILVAGSIDPNLEKKEWFRPILGSFPFRQLLPVDLDVSNREIRPLKGELTKMLPLWSNIRMPVTVIQGEVDDLVPPGNADFAKRMLVNANVTVQMIPEMNHFIPWRRPDLIRKAILTQLAK
ncbi:alpha/beta fold hydrolase [Dyadobacter sp. 3J3]|uniref:alpha/beta fold hydrolase n=1 Tax=Dyadobacter sp. 3J3 TaxID=2606600 RepID=UPI001E2DFE7D|nr:alpha/beta hydrolase [Dyadobacter sp. 3J3]